MISVRRYYYGHEHDLVGSTMTTAQFQSASLRATLGIATTDTNAPGMPVPDAHDVETRSIDDDNEYERQGFSERAGF